RTSEPIILDCSNGAQLAAPLCFLHMRLESGQRSGRLDGMAEQAKQANFVPVKALDKRVPTKRELLRGLVRQAPFVAKNFRLYFQNAWRRSIRRTKVVAPYAV